MVGKARTDSEAQVLVSCIVTKAVGGREGF